MAAPSSLVLIELELDGGAGGSEAEDKRGVGGPLLACSATSKWRSKKRCAYASDIGSYIRVLFPVRSTSAEVDRSIS